MELKLHVLTTLVINLEPLNGRLRSGRTPGPFTLEYHGDPGFPRHQFRGIELCFIKQLLQVNHPFPPGPIGWPLIGSLLDFPSDKPWLTFASFDKTYGDISSMKVLGVNMIILNTAQIASGILDKRSATYSDRPHLTMASELSGWGDLFVLLQNGDRFRQYRRLFHRPIGNKNSLAIFHPAVEDETRIM